MSSQSGGLCMSQCKHWRIPLFLFAAPRKVKRNARESLRLHQKSGIRIRGYRIFSLNGRIPFMPVCAGGVCTFLGISIS